MKSPMKEPSSRKKPDTGSNRGPEDDIPKMVRKIVLEKDVSGLEDDNSDTPEEIIEKPKIRKKVDKKNKNILNMRMKLKILFQDINNYRTLVSQI